MTVTFAVVALAAVVFFYIFWMVVALAAVALGVFMLVVLLISVGWLRVDNRGSY